MGWVPKLAPEALASSADSAGTTAVAGIATVADSATVVVDAMLAAVARGRLWCRVYDEKNTS